MVTADRPAKKLGTSSILAPYLDADRNHRANLESTSCVLLKTSMTSTVAVLKKGHVCFCGAQAKMVTKRCRYIAIV